MKYWRELSFLLFIFILAFAVRYALQKENIYGTDFFFHGSIVKHDLEQGTLDDYDYQVLCYEGSANEHQLGFYTPHYLFARLFGFDAAAIFIPILFGATSIILWFFLMKLLFPSKVAYLSTFFLAISLGNISKTFPYSFRGDMIIYPFLILMLLFLFLFLQTDHPRKKILFSALAGVTSGSLIFFWNGYIVSLLIYYLSFFLYLLYDFFRNKKIQSQLFPFFLSVIVQSAMMFLIFILINIYGKSRVFLLHYYPFLVLFVIFALLLFAYCEKIKSKWPFFASIFLGAAVFVLFYHHFSPLLQGFGSVKTQGNDILELRYTTFHQYYVYYFLTFFSAILGFLFYFRKFNAKKMFFLGYLLPILYLVISANRFLYFSSFGIITLHAYFLSHSFKLKKGIPFLLRKNFDSFIFLTILFILAMFGYYIISLPTFLSGPFDQQLEDAALFLKDHTPSDSCVLVAPDRGAFVEYFANRSIFLHSLGFSERDREATRFLLFSEPVDWNISHFYVLVYAGDFMLGSSLLFRAGIRDARLLPTLFIKLNETFYTTTVHDVNVLLVKDGDAYYTRLSKFYASPESINVTCLQEFSFVTRYTYYNGNLYETEDGDGCVYYFNDSGVFLENALCNGMLFKMATRQKIPDYTLRYSKNGTSIYQYTPSTVLHNK